MDNIKHLLVRQSDPKLYAIPNTTKNFYAVFETPIPGKSLKIPINHNQIKHLFAS